MRRKDGRPKRRSPRNLPRFDFGLRTNPNVEFGAQLTTAADSVSVTSLFSGAGGLDLGFLGGFTTLGRTFERLPFHIVSAVDNLGDAVETYKLNISDQAMLGDLTEIPAAELPAADVLIGGFPCQDFSSSGTKLGLEGDRGRLYRILVHYMQHHGPKVVIAENVPHFARLAGGSIIRTVVREFEEVGYRVVVWELSAPDFGLPQSRRRIFLVAVRDDIEGFPIEPTPTHAGKYVSIDKALADLETVKDEQVTNQSQYFVATRATAGGGQGDHKNRVGEVAYLIRANSRGRIQFHYSLDRRLTVRECARLQSFPDEFVFPFSTQRNLTLIGNAVPPLLAHTVATSVADFLKHGRKVDSCMTERISGSGFQAPLFPVGVTQ